MGLFDAFKDFAKSCMDLYKELVLLRDRIGRLGEQIDKLLGANERLREDNVTLRDRVTRVEAESNANAAQLLKVATTIESLAKENEELRSRVTRLEST
ncbi:MAG: hypothetical protein IH987_06570 [Planctomycetes bacterium]|nr:hypothetical protein [Planctomycetota bacterium]